MAVSGLRKHDTASKVATGTAFLASWFKSVGSCGGLAVFLWLCFCVLFFFDGVVVILWWYF